MQNEIRLPPPNSATERPPTMAEEEAYACLSVLGADLGELNPRSNDADAFAVARALRLFGNREFCMQLHYAKESQLQRNVICRWGSDYYRAVNGVDV